MNRFATHIRIACILAAIVSCWFVSRMVPSPYDETRGMSAGRTQVSAPESTDDSILRTSASEFHGIEVDMRRLTFVSQVG